MADRPFQSDPKLKNISLAGRVDFRRSKGSQPYTRSVVDTGGGAYIGGDVNTGGGTFVGRDQIASHAPANPEAFRALVADINQLLHQVPRSEVTEIIQGDLAVVEQQTRRESPNGAIIKNKLAGMAGLLKSAAGSAADTRIPSLIDRAMQMAGVLFP